jgi:hypothetical protein
VAYPSRVCSQICCVAQTSTHTTQIPLSVRFPTPSQRSHCLRSRPATPTAVFATAPAPETANDSAAAASARRRRSSAEGSVADAALSAACARSAAKPRGPLPLALGPLVIASCLCSGKQRTREQTSLGQFATLLTAGHPAKPLAARRPKVPPPHPPTSYTFAQHNKNTLISFPGTPPPSPLPNHSVRVRCDRHTQKAGCGGRAQPP